MFDTEDDDLDFAPAAGSRLSSLFSQDNTKGNPSLVYTPPKKPKPTEITETQQKSATAGQRFSVVIADIVHSYKLYAGVYCDQSKIGVAILGNAQAHVFQIILYRTASAGKQDYLATAQITEGFHFWVQPNFYCSFYDDAMNNWSILFTSQDSCVRFSRQIGAAIFRAILGKTVVTQMIDPGHQGNSKGETTQLTISRQFFDISSIAPYTPEEATIKVSLNPSQAEWSAGLISANPGSRWAIFIPASTTLPWTSEVSQSPLVLEVVVEEMLNTPTPQAAERVTEKLTSGSEEGSVHSLTESPSNNISSSKASLITRVARMGKATLPLKGAVHSMPSDSETDEENSSVTSANFAKPSVNAKPQLKPRFSKSRSESEPTFIADSGPPVASTIWRSAAVMNTDNKVVQYLPGDGKIMPMTAPQYQLMTAASPVTSPSEPMAMFMSEARMQNTEMRMNMNRIVDKIDSLSTKVDTLSNSATARQAASNPTMDAASLLSSVEKIVKDNQALTAEVADKNEKINELSQRIFFLVENNAKILEQNRVLLDEKQKATEAGNAQTVFAQNQQIEEFESEKTALLEKIAELEYQLVTLEDSNSNLNRSKMSELSAKDDELSAKLSELGIKDSELNDLKNALSAKEAELSKTIAELNNLRCTVEQVDKRVKEAEERCERYEADNSELKDLVTSLSVNISDLESTLSRTIAAHTAEKTAFENQKRTYEETIAQLKTQLFTQMETQLAESGLRRDIDYDSMLTDLKFLLNKVYKKISQMFEVNSFVSGADVRRAVAKVLQSAVNQYSEELLMKKSGCAVKNNVPGDPDHAVKEPPVNPTDPAVGNPVVVPRASSKLEEPEPMVPVEPRRPSTESQTISIPESSKVPSDAEPKVSAAEEARSRNEFWRSEPPPVPNFDDEEDNDDWLSV